VRPVLLGGILPLQTIANDIHDPADHPPVVYWVEAYQPCVTATPPSYKLFTRHLW
jgi:hypothetical protein